MKTTSSSRKGKAIEHFIISDLLKNDFSVYAPVVDDEGVDMIVRDKKGSYVDIQVKSRIINKDEDTFSIKDFEHKPNFIIICHNIQSGNYFVIPSVLFHRHSELFEENGVKKRKLSYYEIELMFNKYMNENGMKFLRKVLDNPDNILKGLNKEGDLVIKK